MNIYCEQKQYTSREGDIHINLVIFTDVACTIYITKTYLYKFDLIKPHFYIVKLGLTGIYIILLILLKTLIVGTC